MLDFFLLEKIIEDTLLLAFHPQLSTISPSAAPTASGNLHFPSQEEITAYLAKHPLTSDLYNQEKRINEAVAKAFANSTKVPMGVQMGVMLTMYDVNENLGLPESAVMAINVNLTAALTDCANGKPIELEKADGKSQL